MPHRGATAGGWVPGLTLRVDIAGRNASDCFTAQAGYQFFVRQ